MEWVSKLSKLKIFDSRMGQFIKRLLWVFRLKGILPYKNLCWSDGLVECQVYAQKYWRSLGFMCPAYDDKLGINRFCVNFHEDNFRSKEVGCIFMHYTEYYYTLLILLRSTNTLNYGALCWG